VLEAGVWTLPGGGQLEVGRVSAAATVGRLLTNQWRSITFSDPFPATPVVLGQLQTHNDPQWVGARQEAVSASGFQATFASLSAGPSTPLRAGLEEEADTAARGREVVGWLAIEQGQGSWTWRVGENLPGLVALAPGAKRGRRWGRIRRRRGRFDKFPKAWYKGAAFEGRCGLESRGYGYDDDASVGCGPGGPHCYFACRAPWSEGATGGWEGPGVRHRTQDNKSLPIGGLFCWPAFQESPSLL
jgi:hypothetical protein